MNSPTPSVISSCSSLRHRRFLAHLRVVQPLHRNWKGRGLSFLLAAALLAGLLPIHMGSFLAPGHSPSNLDNSVAKIPVSVSTPQRSSVTASPTTSGPRPPNDAFNFSQTEGWYALSTANHPPALDDQAMAYDAGDGYVLLFGGFASTGYPVNQTWKFVGGDWYPINVGTSAPPPRDGAAIAYDAIDGYMVLFGGYNYSGHPSTLGDTWIYSAGHWTNLSLLVPSPPPLSFAAMTFDPYDGYVLLFGGVEANGNLNPTTWEFHSGKWSNLSLSAGTQPPPRAYASMGFDPGDNETVLYGGCNSTGGGLHDTWEFRSGMWNVLGSPNWSGPPFDLGMSSGFAPLGLPLMTYGGGSCNIMSGADQSTTSFENQTWQNIPAGGTWPLPLEGDRLAYDATDGYEVLYGGVEDEFLGPAATTTWVFVLSRVNASAIDSNPTSGHLDSGQRANFVANVSGGLGPYIYRWTTNLTGCGSTQLARLSCLPIQTGTFEVALTIRDQTGATSTPSPLEYQVWPGPAIQTATTFPTTIDVGQSVTFEATVSNPGSGGDTFHWISLPPGCLELDQPTLACTPAVAGNSTPSVWVTDSNNETAVVWFGVSVNRDPSVVAQLIGPATVPVGTSVQLSASASAGTPPYNVTWTGLPPGCSSPRVAHVSCSFVAAGTFSINASVVDSTGFHNHSSVIAITVTPSSSGESPVAFSTSTWIALLGLVAALAAVVIIVAVRRRRSPKGPPG